MIHKIKQFAFFLLITVIVGGILEASAPSLPSPTAGTSAATNTKDTSASETAQQEIVAFSSHLAEKMHAMNREVVKFLRDLGTAPHHVMRIVNYLKEPAHFKIFVKRASIFTVVMLLALAASWALRRFFVFLYFRATAKKKSFYIDQLFFVLRLSSVLLMFFVASKGFEIGGLRTSIADFLDMFLGVFVSARFMQILVRGLITPTYGQPTIKLSPATAKDLESRLNTIIIFSLVSYVICQSLHLYTTPEPAIYDVLLKISGFIFSLLVWRVFAVYKKQITNWLEQDSGENKFIKFNWKSSWYSIVNAIILFSYLDWVTDQISGKHAVRRVSYTLVVVLLTYFVIHKLQKVIARIREKDINPGQFYAGRYVVIWIYAIQGILYFAAVGTILQILGIDFIDWLWTPKGSAFYASFLTAWIIFILSFSAWELIDFSLYLYFSRSLKNNPSYFKTLLPVIRRIVQAILVLLTLLIILPLFGVNIAPLLALFGVFGFAFGFGAQEMVKDILRGFFILIEQTVIIGERVTVNNYTGIVEQISLRKLVLRDIHGVVHTIPHGQIVNISNASRDFSVFRMQLAVGAGQKTKDVYKVIENVAASLQKDDEFKDLILEPLKIIGAKDVAAEGYIVIGTMKTLPMKNTLVGLAFYARVQDAFLENGLTFKTSF